MTTGTRILGTPEQHDCAVLYDCDDHPRVNVIKRRWMANPHWEVWDGNRLHLDDPCHATHAEAITAADRLARGEQP